MKKIFTIIFCLVISLATIKVKAQTVTIGDNTDKIYTVVEKEPEFPGGQKAYNKFLYKNLKLSDSY